MYVLVNSTSDYSMHYYVEISISILQHCELQHIQIPKFCYHEQLSISGNCRMCLVEVHIGSIEPADVIKPLIGCATMLSDLMIISINSDLVLKARESILEFLLLNHPLDCPICDQGGECDLQDQSLVFGRDRSRFFELKRSINDKNWGVFIKAIMTRCIHCTRCIRYMNEVIGLNSIGTIGRGNKMEIDGYITKGLSFEHEVIGNVIDICPVGALTSKTYAYRYRSWELTSIESVDIFDSFCSRIRIYLRGNSIMRILPLLDNNLNEDWITDKVRFSYDGFTRQRIASPAIKNNKTGFFLNSSIELIYKYILLNYLVCSKFDLLQNIYIYSGFFLSIDALYILKLFCISIGIYNLNIDLCMDIDVKNKYLIDSSLYSGGLYNTYIVYNINSKLESAILNIKLRILVNASVHNIFFYVGNTIELNFDFKHIGLDMTTLLDIYYGRHYCCFYVNEKNSTHFFTGTDSMLEDIDTFLYPLNLWSWLQYNVLYHFNNLFAGGVGAFELNICSAIHSKLWDKKKYIPKMVYLIGLDTKNFLWKISTSILIIYQGHHIDYGVISSNIVIPSSVYLENNVSVFFNSEGYTSLLSRVLTKNKKSHSDSDILSALFLFFKCNYSVLVDNQNSLLATDINIYLERSSAKFNSPLLQLLSLKVLYDYVFDILFINLILKEFFVLVDNIFIEDSLFITTIRNYYTLDVINKSSLNISKYVYEYTKKVPTNFSIF